MSAVFELIRYEKSERYATITLAHPERRNALNYSFVSELKTAFATAEADEDVKVIVLRAEGPVFCSGIDLAYLHQLLEYDLDAQQADTLNLVELYEQMFKLRKVIITVVEGDAFAAGAGLLAASDLVLCTEGSQISFNQVRFGQIPAPMMGFVLRKIGNGAGRRLFLTGEAISAEEARNMGLISEVLADDAVEERLGELLARLILRNSGGAMELTKRLLADIQDLPLLEGLHFSTRLNGHARLSAEARFGEECYLSGEDFSW